MQASVLGSKMREIEIWPEILKPAATWLGCLSSSCSISLLDDLEEQESLFLTRHACMNGKSLSQVSTEIYRCKKFKKGDLEKESKNMHFNARPVTQRMIMELVGAASDICMLT